MKTLKKGICALLSCMPVFAMVSCSVDNAYDLSKDIDMTVAVGDGLSIPLGSTDTIKLTEMIDPEDSDVISVTDDGAYVIEKRGDFDAVDFEIEEAKGLHIDSYTDEQHYNMDLKEMYSNFEEAETEIKNNPYLSDELKDQFLRELKEHKVPVSLEENIDQNSVEFDFIDEDFPKEVNKLYMVEFDTPVRMHLQLDVRCDTDPALFELLDSLELSTAGVDGDYFYVKVPDYLRFVESEDIDGDMLYLKGAVHVNDKRDQFTMSWDFYIEALDFKDGYTVEDGCLSLIDNLEINGAVKSNIVMVDAGDIVAGGRTFEDVAFIPNITIDDFDIKKVVASVDVDIDDIVWMGPQPSVASKGELVGCKATAPPAEFDKAVAQALAAGRPVHFLPPSRYYNTMKIASLTGIPAEAVRKVAAMDVDGGRHASEELVKAVVSLRIVKEQCEIDEIDKACDIGYLMHTEARRGCKPGVLEQHIVGRMEGVTYSYGWGPSFTTILSQNGETLHNHSHHQILTEGRMVVIDAGAETNSNYTSDFTRTLPASGRFTQQQKEIYSIVAAANNLAISIARPGITYTEVHQAASRLMAQGLVDLGLLKGDADEIVAAGAHSLFMPHGLGHNMGMDVHDMEDLGENYVGYDDTYKRSAQFGLGSLRMGKMLEKGHVVTVEPGIYFIPALIEQWKGNGTNARFINFSKLEAYYTFGGIRLEDDILITDAGCRLLGAKRLPITVEDVEKEMQG